MAVVLVRVSQAEIAIPPGAIIRPPGISPNGLTVNGLGVNGRWVNGLGVNGLGVNGLSLNAINELAANRTNITDTVITLQYVVRCALPQGENATLDIGGTSHQFQGRLGLAPNLTISAASDEEFPLLVACLAASVNPYGVSLPISVLGLDTTGNPIRYNSSPTKAYGQRESYSSDMC
jgi:hypothetical protein